MERRLAAILAADVVGYSRLMGHDETGTLKRLKSLRKELVQPRISQHGGRIFKFMGDGLLAEFASVVEAVRCALEIQSAMHGLDTGLPDADRVRLRIGVNLGDVIVENSDIYGNGVNVAARLEALAEPGGVCISGTVFDHVKGKTSVDFADLGKRQVKNIAEPVRVYGFLPAGPLHVHGASDMLVAGSVPPELPDKTSIAVLPFDNMSGDPEQEYFSDGVAEDIITELSRFSTLFVIARNSSFAFRGQSIDVKQVAKELGVRYVLEGSVRRAGGRVRVTAQLIDSESGRQVWAERYDRDLEDIFALQEEITRNVVGSTAPQVEMAEMARVRSARSGNVSAYDLALKAQAQLYDALRMGSPEVHRQALDTAAAALRLDGRSASALWARAQAHIWGYLWRWSPAPDDALDEAWAAAEQMCQIDSSDPRAYMARGLVYLHRGEHEAAVADMRYAFALNPNFAPNLFAMAWCESLAGYTKEARDHAALGLRLSPRDSELWLGIAHLALAQASFADGDYEETEKWAKLAIQMQPRAPVRHALMIACCIHNGDREKAKKHLDFLSSFAADFVPSLVRGDLTLYSDPHHQASLVEGLRKAQASSAHPFA